MEWQVVVALIVLMPVIILPVVFIWYLNVGGALTAYRLARKERAANQVKAAP
jgi:hypothetical protein